MSITLTPGVGTVGGEWCRQTTLMRMLAGILRASSSGRICDGVEIGTLVRPYREKLVSAAGIRVLPELMVQDHLEYMAALMVCRWRISGRPAIDALLERVSLTEVRRKDREAFRR